MSGRSFWTSAAEQPDAIAVVDTDGRTTTFAELAAATNRLSHALRARGLRPGETIAFMLGNRSELLQIYLAALQIGLYVTPVNRALLAAEVEHLLGDSAARLVFCDAASLGVVHEASARLGLAIIAVDDDGPGSLTALCREQPDHAPDERRLGAPLLYTSGTTGRPKGVRRPLKSGTPEQFFVSEPYLALFGMQPLRGVHLVSAPLCHGAALAWCTDHLHVGHRVVLLEKWTPEAMLRVVAEQRVTAALLVPTHFRRLLALPPETRAAADLRSLTHVVHTGAPCAVVVKQQMMEWLGPVLYEIYASSEGAATMVGPTDWLAHPGTVGRPFPFSRVRVLRPDGSDCAPGERGAVYIRQAGARFEYNADRTKTERAWRGAFFSVGDIGHLDAEGYLYLSDRGDDVIVSGGVNLYPTEIEQVIATCPGVADCAVVGVPDDEWGERAIACVEPAPDAGPELTTRILAHCRAHLAAFKCPRAVEQVARIPRDENGKLQRRRVRDPYWEGRARAI